jgi:hypothetical protein
MLARSPESNSQLKAAHLRPLWAQLEGIRQRKEKADTVNVVCGRPCMYRHGKSDTGLPLLRKEKTDPRPRRSDRQHLSIVVEAPDRAFVEEAVELIAFKNVVRKALVKA